MAERYVVDVVQFALSVDEVNSHHAMTSSWVQSPSDIESIFDAISYDKGIELSYYFTILRETFGSLRLLQFQNSNNKL